MSGQVDEARRAAEELVGEHWHPSLTVGAWWRLLADAGLSFADWPDGLGGRGWSADAARAVHGVLAAAGALRPPTGLGTAMGGPVVAAHGTPEQQARFLPPLARGEESWCQLFSEPGAGSDLAGVTTRAERDGHQWVVTGQKVWTSGAQVADRGMLVARTDAHAPKHRGLTYFVIPMDQPGIEVRPLRQMTGETHFNEVFLDEAVVDERDVVGPVGGGWAVTVATLALERGDMGAAHAGGPSLPGGGRGGRLDEPIEVALARAQAAETGRDPRRFTTAAGLIELARDLARLDDPVRRDRLVRLHVLDEIARISAARTAAATRSGRPPGPETSVAKLAWSERLKLARDLGVELLGADGMLAGAGAPEQGDVVLSLLSVPATSIAGGTDEVQRTLIGERALGLPREPAPDRDAPFDSIPKNR